MIDVLWHFFSLWPGKKITLFELCELVSGLPLELFDLRKIWITHCLSIFWCVHFHDSFGNWQSRLIWLNFPDPYLWQRHVCCHTCLRHITLPYRAGSKGSKASTCIVSIPRLTTTPSHIPPPSLLATHKCPPNHHRAVQSNEIVQIFIFSIGRVLFCFLCFYVRPPFFFDRPFSLYSGSLLFFKHHLGFLLYVCTLQLSTIRILGTVSCILWHGFVPLSTMCFPSSPHP